MGTSLTLTFYEGNLGTNMLNFLKSLLPREKRDLIYPIGAPLMLLAVQSIRPNESYYKVQTGDLLLMEMFILFVAGLYKQSLDRRERDLQFRNVDRTQDRDEEQGTPHP